MPLDKGNSSLDVITLAPGDVIQTFRDLLEESHSPTRLVIMDRLVFFGVFVLTVGFVAAVVEYDESYYCKYLRNLLLVHLLINFH